MSEREDMKISYLISKFEQHAAETKEQLAEIRRGVYGDKPNGTEGLLDRDRKQEERIKNLEDHNKKMKWMGAGFVLALQGIGIAVYEFFIKRS